MNAENIDYASAMSAERELGQLTFVTVDATREEEVRALFATEYGQEYADSYVGPTLFTTDALTRGIHIGFEDDGKLIAYATTARRPEQPWLYYASDIVVSPEYRGRGIGKLMIEKRLELMRGNGGTVAHFYLVCGRQERESQKNILGHAGFTPLGIEPFKLPGLNTRRLPEGQAESMAIAMRYLECESAESNRKMRIVRHKIYLPDKYREAMQLLGFNFQDATERKDVAGKMFPPLVERGAIVKKSGKGSYTVHVNVSVPVALPLIKHYQEQGFLLSAFCPGLGRTESEEPVAYDYIRMYKPPGMQCDFSAIHVLPELEAFKEFQEKEYLDKAA